LSFSQSAGRGLRINSIASVLALLHVDPRILHVAAAAAVILRCILKMHIAVGVKISACVTSWMNMSSSMDSMQKKKKKSQVVGSDNSS
jgi:hypothetical protein